MGNGPSETLDSAKQTPLEMGSLPLNGTEASGSGFDRDADAGSFCTSPQTAEVALTSPVGVGEEIRLIIGKPPAIYSSANTHLGTIKGQQAVAMQNCLELGYRMRGSVTAVSPDGRRGRINIKGSME